MADREESAAAAERVARVRETLADSARALGQDRRGLALFLDGSVQDELQLLEHMLTEEASRPGGNGQHHDGHQIASAQLAKHGRDRHPTSIRQLAQLIKEIGELAEAIDYSQHPTREHMQRVRDEYADVGLSYFELGNKLGLDAIECMRQLVDADRRKFGDDHEV